MLVLVSPEGSTEANMHDVVVAFVFLAIVILPAIVATRAASTDAQ